MIPERESNDSHVIGDSQVPPGYNRFKVHQRDESFSYEMELLFSNEIAPQTGDFLAHVAGFGERAAASKPIPQRPSQASSVVEVEQVQPALPQLAPAPDSVAEPNPDATHSARPLPTIPDEQAIRYVFDEHEGRLTLQVSDLKAQNQKDYTLRLVHMFLLARQRLFNARTTLREEVSELTEFAGLSTSNVSAYLSQDSDSTREGDKLSLTIGGIDHARRCFAEILDPAVPAGQWTPSTHARMAPKPRKATKRGGDTQLDEAQIAALVEHAETKAIASVISHKTISGMSILDKVILALYGLNRAGHEAEVYYATIKDYLYRAFRVKLETDSIGSALRNATSNRSPYIVHMDGAGYRITPTGATYIKDTYRVKDAASLPASQLELMEQ